MSIFPLIGKAFFMVISYPAVLVVGFLMGGSYVKWLWKHKCVTKGVAEFYLDDKHLRRWRWIPKPNPVKAYEAKWRTPSSQSKPKP